MRTITKKLTEICRPKQWKTIPGKDLLTEGYPVFGANGIIGYWSEYNHVSETITIACRGTCGAVRIADAKSYINGNAMCLDDLSNSVLLKYLYYYLRWYDFSDIITGTSIPQITIEGLRKVIVPIPPISDQQAIISILEKADTVIQGRAKELDILDELIKARFVEMFGDEENPYNWPVVSVEEVANVSVGVVIKPAQYYTDAEHGVKAFRSLNIGPMTIKDGDWVYFSYEGNEKNAKSQLKEKDLLIVRSGAPGTACVVSKQYEGCNAIDIIIARPNTEQVDPYYLCTYTNMPHGKRQIEEGTGGAAQQHFNVGKYNKLRLMLPPMSLQKEFFEVIAQVDKSKVVYMLAY